MDRDTFTAAALEHLDAVYGLALRLSRRPEEAEDLVQETFLRALRAADDFVDRGIGLRPWLLRIAYNLFCTRYARARREAPSGDAVEAEVDHRTDAPDAPGPAWDLAHLDWEHVDDRLKRAIEDLRPEYRAALLLWGVEGLKYREIAEIQDVPIGTVMSRLHRARAQLAAQLGDLAEERRIVRGSDD